MPPARSRSESSFAISAPAPAIRHATPSLRDLILDCFRRIIGLIQYHTGAPNDREASSLVPWTQLHRSSIPQRTQHNSRGKTRQVPSSIRTSRVLARHLTRIAFLARISIPIVHHNPRVLHKVTHPTTGVLHLSLGLLSHSKVPLERHLELPLLELLQPSCRVAILRSPSSVVQTT